MEVLTKYFFTFSSGGIKVGETPEEVGAVPKEENLFPKKFDSRSLRSILAPSKEEAERVLNKQYIF